MVRRITLILLLIILLLCANGCSLGILRGHDACVREKNARIVYEEADFLLTKLCPTPTRDVTLDKQMEEVRRALTRIKERTLDEVARAKVMQKDHGHEPKEPVNPESQEADTKFNELAGRVQARAARRRFLKELPAKIATGVAKVAVSLIPRPIRAMIKIAAYLAVVTVLGTLLFWVWQKMRFFRRSTQEAIQGAARLPEEQRRELFGDKLHLKRVFKENGIS